MSIALHIALGRLRIVFMVAGLAWFVGLDAHLAVRIGIAGLAILAVIFDGVIDDQHIARAAVAAKTPPDDYRTAA
ncbi:hypothetical protein ACWGMA_08200 [Streptomyces asiaticus]